MEVLICIYQLTNYKKLLMYFPDNTWVEGAPVLGGGIITIILVTGRLTITKQPAGDVFMDKYVKIMPLLLLCIYTVIVKVYLCDEYLVSRGLSYKDSAMVTTVAILGFGIGALSGYLAKRLDHNRE